MPIVLTDADATLANIDKAFDDLAGRTKPDDLVFVFLAGHGVALDGTYYLYPGRPAGHPGRIDSQACALTYDDLAARLGKFPTARAIVVLDTCYSGAFAVDDSILRDSRDQTVGKQISHATGRFILAGSSSQQEALDGVNGHGVFTEVLLTRPEGRRRHPGRRQPRRQGQHLRARRIRQDSRSPSSPPRSPSGYNQKPRWFFNGDEMFDLRDVN